MCRPRPRLRRSRRRPRPRRRPRSRRAPRGHTLLELATALLLLGVGVSVLHPLARRGADRMAVEGARERVVGIFDRARAEARAAGGAEIEIRADEALVLLRRAGVEVGRADLVRTGVSLEAGAGTDLVEVRFDALGLGRVASRTLVFRRGGERAELVVSALGRVSRR